MKNHYLTLLLLAVVRFGAAQSGCDHVLQGQVMESSTKQPLEFAEIFIRETGTGAVTDSAGRFRINGVCKGDYHVRISHLGCASQVRYVDLDTSLVLVFYLDHHVELLDEVAIHGDHAGHTLQVHQSLDEDKIRQGGSQNLANLLSQQVIGVRSLKNGNGIAKPIIQGLTGNRVGIVNNGAIQAGQQWGNDHAPEIDPFVADHISVIKGAGSLEYGGNTLGGVIVIKPGSIANDPHLHGQVLYNLESNGWAHTLNAKVEQSTRWGRWRATGTVKLGGDTHTPDYFLTNTGHREYDVAFQWEKTLFDKWESDIYYSYFNTEIGILRGSHIGNLTDLEDAIQRDEPFFTSSSFSYAINAPRQVVHHHLLKAATRRALSTNADLTIQYVGQLNEREEYDVRRGDRSDRPALSLRQWDQTWNVHYKRSSDRLDLLKLGIQGTLRSNKNDPETGIRPLIPDYDSYGAGLFGIVSHSSGRWSWEGGMRYDITHRDVRTITSTIPAMVVTYQPTYHRVSLSGGLQYRVNQIWASTINLVAMTRNPEVNELYSNGLHQGVSGIEEGNLDLKDEHGYKILWSQDLDVGNRAFFQIATYYQYIDDYIFLEPQDELRLTIRGAFPVFKYQQTDARLAGWDVLWKMEWNTKWQSVLSWSAVRGQDVQIDQPLIGMPADQWTAAVTYNLTEGKQFKNTEFTLSGTYVARQERYNESLDYLPPPDAYFLLGMECATTIQLADQEFRLSLSGVNLLNTVYRDYLNRLRYFADEQGINVRLGVSWKW